MNVFRALESNRYVDGGWHGEFFLLFHPLIFPFNADTLLPHVELFVLFERRS
jgi:hypothetical protein